MTRSVAQEAAASRTLWNIFCIPVVLGVSSAIGLFAALVGDDWYDRLSWLTLAVLPLVIAVAICRPQRKQARNSR